MSLIRFTRDFRGRASNEQYYQEGEVVDCPTAALIVAEGAAVFVDPTPADVIETMTVKLEAEAAQEVPAPEPPKKSKGRK